MCQKQFGIFQISCNFMRTVKKLTLAEHLLRRPTNGLGFMNAIFLHGDHQHLLATHVAIFRVVGTRIQLQL